MDDIVLSRKHEHHWYSNNKQSKIYFSQKQLPESIARAHDDN